MLNTACLISEFVTSLIRTSLSSLVTSLVTCWRKSSNLLWLISVLWNLFSKSFLTSLRMFSRPIIIVPSVVRISWMIFLFLFPDATLWKYPELVSMGLIYLTLTLCPHYFFWKVRIWSLFLKRLCWVRFWELLAVNWFPDWSSNSFPSISSSCLKMFSNVVLF